jgi:L-lactate dehydrogenase
LAYNPQIEKLLVMSRREDTANGAIMDVASANPKGAAKMQYVTYKKISDADIIVLTAGVQMQPGQAAKDVFVPNASLTESIINAGSVKDTAIIICLATPVDDITPLIQHKSKLPFKQIFGFGGDLDRNRLEHILQTRKANTAEARIVGEHGRNAIPVYLNDSDYEIVAGEVRGFLGRLTKLAGETRNLATGDLLAKLVNSIITNANKIHYLCGYHEEYGVYLTWPFVVGCTGIIAADRVSLSSHAAQDLEKLVSLRKNFLKQNNIALSTNSAI